MRAPRVSTLLGATGLVLAILVFLFAPLAVEQINGDLSLLAIDVGPRIVREPEPDRTGVNDGFDQSQGTPSDTRPRQERVVDPALGPDVGAAIQPPQSVPDLPEPAAHAVVAEVNGQPVRWDPCTPIRYVVRRQAGPEQGLELIEEGLRRVSEATGLTFQYEGLTDSSPGDWKSSGSLTTVADAWIGWAFEDESSFLVEDEGILGVGGPEWDTQSGRISKGFVVLRADTTLEPRFGPGLTMGNLILHELGHMIGLEHVDTPTEIMGTLLSDDTPGDWGPGDRAGLYSVGSARGCFPQGG